MKDLQEKRLILHMDRSKILTSSATVNHQDRDQWLKINKMYFQILKSSDTHKYLRRMINLNVDDRRSHEISARISKAWGAYHKYRKCLCNREASLKLRLKLFNACISPVALYGLAILPLTKYDLNQIAVQQRKMLRSIVGWEFISGESYENTMSRMKRKMTYANTLYHVESWDTRILKMQMNYMLHLSTLDHFHPARILLDWNSMIVRDASQISNSYRSVGRPKIK